MSRKRCLRPEMLDQPGLDPREHRVALRGLARLNWLSRSAAVLWPPLAEAAECNGRRPLRVIDLASGAGDVVLQLWRKAQTVGLPLHFQGFDISPLAVEHATAAAHLLKADVRFFHQDIVQGPPLPACDIAICSLFLHHLSEEAAISLLRRMAASAKRLVLVNDLERSALNHFLVWTATRLVSRSTVVHVDGPRSVEGAFAQREAQELADRAGLEGATVERRFPCRFLLRWERS